MTFEQQAAELHRLEGIAKSLGLSEAAFERIAKEVSGRDDMTPEEKLAEIRKKVMVKAARTA